MKNQKADIRSDIWSLGCVYDGSSIWEVLKIGSDENDHIAIEAALRNQSLQEKVTNAVKTHLSEDVRNVLFEMLVVDPFNRGENILQILNKHTWLKGGITESYFSEKFGKLLIP